MEVFLLAGTKILTFLARFATQLLAAEMLFAPVLKKRSFFWVRLVAAVSVYSVIPYLLPGHIYGWNALVFFGWLNLNWMLVFALSMGVFLFVFRVSVKDTFFYGTAAYAVQHTIRNLARFVTSVAVLSGIWLNVFILVFTALLFPLFYYFFVRKLKEDNADLLNNKYIFIFAIVIIAFVFLLSLWVDRDGSGPTSRLYAASCCILLLIIQFNLFEQSKIKRQKEEIERLLHNEQEYHLFSQENIDIINMKCHNLKHQIAAIRAMKDANVQREELKELEDAVLIYENTAMTGNRALDTLLTEKSLYCEKHEIRFSYLADVSALGALTETDLYSLLGNAIDNAIEGTMKIKDKEQRIISLKIDCKHGVLKIHMDNSFDGELLFENGLPKTTKADSRFHGYGMKSIRYIAEKYGGTCYVRAEDGIFNLDVVIPVQYPVGPEEGTA